jgi:hypothetical protein
MGECSETNERLCKYCVLILSILQYNLVKSIHLQGSRAGRPRGRSFSPGRGKIFSPLHSVQTGYGSHTASYPMGSRGLFLLG